MEEEGIGAVGTGRVGSVHGLLGKMLSSNRTFALTTMEQVVGSQRW